MKSAQAWFEKGMKARNPETAVAAFDEALGLEPGHLGALRERGLALAQLGRHEAALDSFVAAAAQTKDDPELLLAVAQSLAKLQRHAEALKSCEQVLTLRPGDEEALFGRADALMALDDFEQALPVWEAVLGALKSRRARGLIADARSAHARRSRVLALGRLDRPQAFAAFCELIEVEVNQLTVPSRRDFLLQAVRRPEIAGAAFRSWIERHASEPSTWRHAEDIWFEKTPGGWNVVNSLAQGWFDKAEAQVQAGELSAAIYGYERSLELHPEFSRALRHKAVLAQRDTGRWIVMSHNAYAREDSVAGEFATKAEAAAYLAQLQASSDEHYWLAPVT